MNMHSAVMLVALGLLPPVLASAEADKLKFSHNVHIEGVEIECTVCHRADPKNNRRMQVNTSACVDCHDELYTYDFGARHRKLHAAFPHPPHVDALDCVDCHSDIAGDAIKNGAPVLTRSRCLACHEENGAEVGQNQCARCHGVDQSRQKPGDHHSNWLRRHGPESRWRVFEQHGTDCQLCHSERACQKCHLTRKPKDHGGLWRVRTHGRAAAWDRDRCKTCHETGSCRGCHQFSRPAGHRGDWKRLHGRVAGGFDNNCQVCHTRAQCIACHRGEGLR